MNEFQKEDTKLLREVHHVLQEFPQYWDGETLQKTKLIEDIRSYKKTLIQALLRNETIKNTYSLQVDDLILFKVEQFIEMLRYKNYWANSYTSYLNEIGLTSEGKYLKYNSDIVLDFPHKDCVLEAGMTKEDVTKKEVYYHHILAKEEIDTLLAPKVLSNVKRYDEHGVSSVNHFQDEENLIIKGNNLIAISSLLRRYEGNIKCVYIDPPYNPNSAANTFSYNNRFNHSTWLTFMKNRVEIAHRLLKDDGVFCCAIDHNELFYLGVLLDEIFGRDNRLGIVAVETNPGGRSDSTFFATSHEYFIVYAKNHELAKINEIKKDANKLSVYNLEDEISKYKLVPLRRTGSNSTPDKRPNLCYPIYYHPEKETITVEQPENNDDWVEIMPMGSDRMRVWRWSKEKVMSSLQDIEVKESNGTYNIYVKDRIKDTEKAKTMWYGSKYDASANGTKVLQKLGLGGQFSYPKSVYLMRDIIELLTDEGDMILDYHLGSATTAAVAHKMNRRYIGIEQMDYIEDVAVPRLQQIIAGDDGDISKEFHWQGGGSFIYAELTTLNEVFIRDIQEAVTEAELVDIIDDIKERAYVNFTVEFSRVTSEEAGFHLLSLEEKKAALLHLLDMNQLYVNYSEIEDSQFSFSDEIKHFNHSFYRGGDE